MKGKKGKKRVLVGLEAQVNRPTDHWTDWRTAKEGRERQERTKTWEQCNITERQTVR